MRSVSVALAAVAVACTLPLGAAHADELRLPRATRQLLLVESDGWEATAARLTRWQRDGRKWRQVGEPIAVVLGRAGLGWGRGLVPPSVSAALGGPTKAEGDGRSPAGIFRLGDVTGYAPVAAHREVKLRYRQAGERLRCVDDTRAPEYNRLVELAPGAAPTWTSDEKMRRDDALYEETVFVEHNTAPAVPGAGSCIFLHVWRGPGASTVGCTAMPLADLQALVAWLDPRRQPLLVQLPHDVREKVAKAWRLPRD